ncbi:ABC transporter permease [Zavarzinia compransoris]|uniref:ABC transporter permease n=1 Tax=Zavarzinia marina TaxID=2911065 RepID=UPI001F1D78CF|nr:ABC transporter permease [Zavarzinia marina]MCF4166268.1 ABC transporter permease [Zavarzinia marina]
MMPFTTILVMAFNELRRNLMRSILTTLGIVIGIAAVIALVTLGQGATASITDQISSLGRNLIVVAPGNAGKGGPPQAAAPFKLADVRAIEREVTGLRAVAAVSTAAVPVVLGNNSWASTAIGADANYFAVREWPLASGRAFDEGEIRSGRTVCVIGQRVVTEIFGAQDPIGAPLRVGGFPCNVIGTLAEKGRSIIGNDQDDVVVMPLKTFQRRISGNQDVSLIMVSASTAETTATAKEDITAILRERRHITANKTDDFQVNDVSEIANIVGGVTVILTAFLGAIAAISLVVGGIGIMNIMLVAVTERTREIGIRLAIGALEREVLAQFLIEAVLLALFGGMIGVVLGLTLSAVGTTALGLPLLISPGVIVLATLFSGLVGVGFGYFPARRAARMDPIDALRHE